MLVHIFGQSVIQKLPLVSTIYLHQHIPCIMASMKFE